MSSIISNLIDFEEKIIEISSLDKENDKLLLLIHIVRIIYIMNTESKTDRKELIPFKNFLKDNNFFEDNFFDSFKDYITQLPNLYSIINNKLDIETINYIISTINTIIEIEKDKQKIEKEKQEEEIQEEEIQEDYFEQDFEDEDEDEIIEEIEDKIENVLEFLKELCTILTGFIHNKNQINLRTNINRINSTIINTIKNTPNLKKLFIIMDIKIISLFINFISNSTDNDILLKGLFNKYELNKDDVIDVLNKFKYRQITAGKKKKKGKRILKKYKK